MKALILVPALLATQLLATPARATTAAEQLAGYARESGVAADPARGQALFTQGQGREWSCASCHTSHPTAEGQHASTGKRIAPLAPAAHAQRFTDAAKTEKWFRRNCSDVLGRTCTAGEKADVLAWLLSFGR